MPVLGTKLHIPVPRRQLVSPDRLTDRLRTGKGSVPRLVLIGAPAGFGKTTLMTQWVTSLGTGSDEAGTVTAPALTVAWLSLDAGDSEPRAFLTDLLAAVQSVRAEIGADARAQLESDRGTPTQAVLVSLVNDLDTMAGPIVIALDDYHVIDSPAVHEAVTFLLDNLPPQTTLAMTTRADPPLPLARLRARGELLEVRAADLRFTPDEAGAFLNDVMGLHLDPAQVAALEARTEGWAAGLQLAALSARSRASPHPHGSWHLVRRALWSRVSQSTRYPCGPLLPRRAVEGRLTWCANTGNQGRRDRGRRRQAPPPQGLGLGAFGHVDTPEGHLSRRVGSRSDDHQASAPRPDCWSVSSQLPGAKPGHDQPGCLPGIRRVNTGGLPQDVYCGRRQERRAAPFRRPIGLEGTTN